MKTKTKFPLKFVINCLKKRIPWTLMIWEKRWDERVGFEKNELSGLGRNAMGRNRMD